MTHPPPYRDCGFTFAVAYAIPIAVAAATTDRFALSNAVGGRAWALLVTLVSLALFAALAAAVHVTVLQLAPRRSAHLSPRARRVAALAGGLALGLAAVAAASWRLPLYAWITGTVLLPLAYTGLLLALAGRGSRDGSSSARPAA